MTFSKFIAHGNLERHTNKMVKIYKQRRDIFCKLLKEELSEFIEFEIPKGGMAIWVYLDKKYAWKQITVIAKKYGLEITDYKNYDPTNSNHNGMRFGFASYTVQEIEILIQRLKKVLLEAKKTI